MALYPADKANHLTLSLPILVTLDYVSYRLWWSALPTSHKSRICINWLLKHVFIQLAAFGHAFIISTEWLMHFNRKWLVIHSSPNRCTIQYEFERKETQRTTVKSICLKSTGKCQRYAYLLCIIQHFDLGRATGLLQYLKVMEIVQLKLCSF